MSSEIQIVNFANLCKIDQFLSSDSSYLLLTASASNFNSKLCGERRTRAFLDHQTGILQQSVLNNLSRQCRMPGFRDGQIYTYPSRRWRKSKRQYLTKLQNLRPFRNVGAAAAVTSIAAMPVEEEYSQIQPQPLAEEISLSADISDHSKDSQNLKEDIPKDWYYDEIDINNLEDIEDPDQDSDYDYNLNGYRRKRKRDRKPAPSRKSRAAEREPTPQFSMGGESSNQSSPRKGRPPGSVNGSGTRRPSRRAGSRKTPAAAKGKFQEEPTPVVPIEPPSFETAMANFSTADDGAFSNDLRNYRKYI